jgi:hypothetical protein
LILAGDLGAIQDAVSALAASIGGSRAPFPRRGV